MGHRDPREKEELTGSPEFSRHAHVDLFHELAERYSGFFWFHGYFVSVPPGSGQEDAAEELETGRPTIHFGVHLL